MYCSSHRKIQVRSFILIGFTLSGVLFLINPAFAVIAQKPKDYPIYREEPSRNPELWLSAEQILRVKKMKSLLKEVDRDSLEKTFSLLRRTTHPEENLQIMEAVAQTYSDIIQEQNVTDPKKKEWLLSMIQLNMGFMQMGGLNTRVPQDSPLNKMIRRKLKEHLSPELLEHPEVFYSVEELQKKTLR